MFTDMKFKKVVYYNVVVMMLGNICCFSSENETATSALNNLIKTTADSLAQNQDNKNANQTTEQTQTDSGTTALPVFDDVSNNTTPVNTQQNNVSQTIPQQDTTTVQIQQQDQPNVAQSQIVQTIPQTNQNSQVKKRVGFISKNGVALIAPDDMLFPNEMQDGEVYYFSRDIESLKAKIAQGTQIFPQQQPMISQQQVLPQQMASQQIVHQQPNTQQFTQQQGITQSQQKSATTQISPQQTQTNADDCKDCHVWLKTSI